MPKQPCTNCGTKKAQGQRWGLTNYFGISGWFCPACYEKVSHDVYSKPRYPELYKVVMEKQQKAIS